MWFDRLPQMPLTVGSQTLFIYTGVVNGITNVVYMLDETSTLHVARTTNAGNYWRFNYDNGRFEIFVSGGTGWSQSVIDQTGRAYTQYSGVVYDNITMADVRYKLSP